MLNPVQLREVFHFCFLERLLKIADPRLFVLKGGVNLRFYLNSPRYSEDMDIDVFGGSVDTLKKNGYKLLNDKAFLRVLNAYGISSLEINDPEKAKHTETTQRFRLSLVDAAGQRYPTKVEFSRRKTKIVGAENELIDANIARSYKRLSFACNHYSGEFAAIQKVLALAGRPATQARDVFDLNLLALGGHVNKAHLQQNTSKVKRQKALEALLGLDYQDYQGQVVEFLDEEGKQRFAGKAAWENMQSSLMALLDQN